MNFNKISSLFKFKLLPYIPKAEFADKAKQDAPKKEAAPPDPKKAAPPKAAAKPKVEVKKKPPMKPRSYHPWVPNMPLMVGGTIPQIGLGTWKSHPSLVEEAVKYAIDIGYRQIDCAFIFNNQREIGNAIKAKIADGTVKREQLFISGKLWNTYHRPDLVEHALKVTLCQLQLDYLDLWIMQWPFAFKEGDQLFPIDDEGNIVPSPVSYIETWEAMEECVKKCLTKYIGISNFNKRQIEQLLKCSTIKPALVQLEMHPYLQNDKLREFCRMKKLPVAATSPLVSRDREEATENDPVIFTDPDVIKMAKKYCKTPAQIVLRFAAQRGLIVVVKSTTKCHLRDNIDIFDFELDSVEMCTLFSKDCGFRAIPYEVANCHPEHPFVRDKY